jgi:putative redox protein
MTLRMYADRKQWPLQGVQVRLGHSRIHAEDCAACDIREGMIDQIDAEISLIGDLSESQRQRLMEIAEHCPVHRTLLGDIQIRLSPNTHGASIQGQPRRDAQDTSA